MEAKSIEVWVDVIGYENSYQVSNLGRVRSVTRTVVYKSGHVHVHKGRILKPIIDKDGYATVGLFKQGKQIRKKVHRLVAEAFLPNPDNLDQVNHKDECKSNNVLSNLEWCDCLYNQNYGTRNQRIIETKRRRKQL